MREPILGWIGLYSADMLDWMENQNKINMEEICPKSMVTEERNTCIENHLKPIRKKIDVRKAPTRQSQILGQIEIIATPVEGLSAVWITPTSSLPFMTEMYDQDWGYGTYFHMTVLGRQGTWFLLPQNPFPYPAWIDISELTLKSDFKSVDIGEVYIFEHENIVICSIGKETVTVREEQPADIWCDGGDPPPISLKNLRTLKIHELFDKDCHLKLHVKYTRGC
jgi:hypothetical protein